MTVTAPPESPRPEPLDVEAQEALIKEARRRARRRQLWYAASALAVGAIALAVFGFVHRGGGGAGRGGDSAAASARAPISRLPAPPANGLLTIEDRKTLDVTNPDSLFVVRPDDSGLRPLTRCEPTAGGCGFGGYVWSPDGKRLAFVSGHFGGAITASNLFLFVVNADGTGRRRLARCRLDCGSGQAISWSPDSRRIVLAASRLTIVNVATGAQQRLGVFGVNPVWSPAGARIAFVFAGALFSIKPDGSGMTQLAAAADPVGDPSWSPDGTMIAFDAGDKIEVVDADGSNLRSLVEGPKNSGPGYPSWSPRGNRILFLDTPRSAGGFVAEVSVVKPDGSGRQRLYRSPCCGLWSRPIWSPDGKAIAVGMSQYTAQGVTQKGILIMNAQGNHRRRVLGNPEAIAWQPIPRTR